VCKPPAAPPLDPAPSHTRAGECHQSTRNVVVDEEDWFVEGEGEEEEEEVGIVEGADLESSRPRDIPVRETAAWVQAGSHATTVKNKIASLQRLVLIGLLFAGGPLEQLASGGTGRVFQAAVGDDPTTHALGLLDLLPPQQRVAVDIYRISVGALEALCLLSGPGAAGYSGTATPIGGTRPPRRGRRCGTW
jgi:hypothetical protein